MKLCHKDSLTAETAFLLAESFFNCKIYIITGRDPKGCHLVPNLAEETKKSLVDFFKTSSRPLKRPHEDLETLQQSKYILQARTALIIKARSTNSSSVVIRTKELNIWSSNWIGYGIKQAGMKLIRRFLKNASEKM